MNLFTYHNRYRLSFIGYRLSVIVYRLSFLRIKFIVYRLSVIVFAVIVTVVGLEMRATVCFISLISLVIELILKRLTCRQNMHICISLIK